MFDRSKIMELCTHHGPVARVVVAAVKGSAPREIGASMIVWADGQVGTIGGGTLEFQAANAARARLDSGAVNVARLPLGPAMNQCCGGAVTLVTEVFDASALDKISGPTFARRIEGRSEMPPQLRRAANRSQAMGQPSPFAYTGGWLSEPLTHQSASVVIYGAGHVGVALAKILRPLPEFSVTLADDRPSADCPTIVRQKSDTNPTAIFEALTAAPNDALHFVMTHAHDLDLSICHALLSRPTGGIGLIGSATKWARFRKRLQSLGHSSEAVSRITCPIGDPALGKHPQAIALGVANDLLRAARTPITKREAV